MLPHLQLVTAIALFIIGMMWSRKSWPDLFLFKLPLLLLALLNALEWMVARGYIIRP